MPDALTVDPNLAAPDDFYEALIDMHRGLDAQQSALVNARLILLLANHVGDLRVLREAMQRARAGIGDALPDAAGTGAHGA
jgi:hypothetical protein